MVPGSTLMYGSSFINVTLRPRASRMDASEADAMPLPREDTTPPVTKIRGVMERPLPESRILHVEPGDGRRETGRRKPQPAAVHVRMPPLALLASRDEFAHPRPSRRTARRHARARRRILPGSHRRPPPVRIPAGALDGARVVVRLYRLGGHLADRGGIRRIVDGFALLRTGGTRTGRRRHRADETQRAAHARTPAMAARTHARGRARGLRGGHAFAQQLAGA